MGNEETEKMKVWVSRIDFPKAETKFIRETEDFVEFWVFQPVIIDDKESYTHRQKVRFNKKEQIAVTIGQPTESNEVM